MIAVDYVMKFKELYRFYLHYNGVGTEGSKCMKFESGLHHEIKQFIGYQEIHRFYVLVNKCRIYDEDNCARSTHYKSINGKKTGSKNRGKPYGALTDNGKWKALGGKETSGRGIYVPMKWFKCGKVGHHATEYRSSDTICFKCNKPGHHAMNAKMEF